jgi:hypothetical protein
MRLTLAFVCAFGGVAGSRQKESLMRRLAIASIVLLAVAAPAWAIELTVVNHSQYVIKELYVSPAKSKKWGGDQLQQHSIGTNQSFTLHNIPVGVYDLKLVDEDDDSCVVSNVSFSDNDKEWTLTDAVLETCEGDDE